MKVLLVSFCLSIVAVAQKPVNIALHPIDFGLLPVESNESTVDALQSEVRRLTRMTGATLASTPVDTHTDCRENNVSLAELAKQAGSLYAIHTYVDSSLTGVLTVVARVVRDDGIVVREAVTAQYTRTSEPFIDVASKALRDVFAKLKLSELTASGPVATVLTAQAAEQKIPPPTVIQNPSPIRPIAISLVGVGAAASVVGAFVFAFAPRKDIVDSKNIIEVDSLVAQQRQSTEVAGVSMMIGGGVAAIAGALLLIATADMSGAPVLAAVRVTPQAVTIVASGSF